MLLTKSFLLSSTEDISFTQNSHRGKQGKSMRGDVFFKRYKQVNACSTQWDYLSICLKQLLSHTFTCLNGEAPFGCKNLLQFSMWKTAPEPRQKIRKSNFSYSLYEVQSRHRIHPAVRGVTHSWDELLISKSNNKLPHSPALPHHMFERWSLR